MEYARPQIGNLSHVRGLTPKAISLKLDLHLSTCYHLVNTLVATGFLQRRPDTQAYVLGAKIAHLNSAFLEALEVLPVLQAHAQTLHDTTGETAYLGQWQDDVVISAIVKGTQPVRVQSLYVGYRGNAHAMALDKVLLAYLPPHEQAHFLAQHALPACTPCRGYQRHRQRSEHALTHVRCGIDLSELLSNEYLYRAKT